MEIYFKFVFDLILKYNVDFGDLVFFFIKKIMF